MKVVNVVLSGGVGSRLWPLSRKSRPKQYLPIFGGQSLFEKTVIRNSEICNQVMVVGGVDNYQLSRDILKKTATTDYIELVEAAPRNTAAAIAFAALSLPEDAIMLVTPSDHLIGDQEKYNADLSQAVALAKNGDLVTFGLIPSKPETGFGYIEHVLKTSKAAMKNAKEGFLPLDLSMEIPSISVDYAVMERSDKIKVIPSNFSWSDMGSFEALFEYYPIGSKERVGENLVLGTGKHVEFIGMEDVVLVETDDAILVLNRKNAQDVKKVYERLEKENPSLLN